MRNKKSTSLIISLISIFIIGLSFIVGFLIYNKNEDLLKKQETKAVSVIEEGASV